MESFQAGGVSASASTVLTGAQGVKKLYQALFAPLLAQWGLTQTEADILMFLANHPAFDTARDMVEKRHLAKSHISAGVEALAARGLIERWYQNGNRKTIHLRPTDAAAAIIQAGRAIQERFIALLMEGFTGAETAWFQQMLCRIAQNAETALAAEQEKKQRRR